MHRVMWRIWKEMNLRLFEGKARSYGEVIDCIVREVGGWVLMVKENHGIPISMFLCDWASAISWSSPKARLVVLDWILPPEGCFKLNFDGASKENLGPTGFGCVLRDHSSKVICVLYSPLEECDSTTTEVMGLLMGLH